MKSVGLCKLISFPCVLLVLALHVLALGEQVVESGVESANIDSSVYCSIELSDVTASSQIGGNVTLNYIGSTLWSQIRDVVVEEHYAFCAMVSGVSIFDIADPSYPLLVSQTYLEHGGFSIAKSGDYLFVGMRSSGMEVLDISDPSVPVRIGRYETRCTGYAIAVCDNNVFLACGTRIDILNVEDPSSPLFVDSFPLPGVEGYVPKDIEINGGYAFIAAGDVWIIDILSPSAPVQVARYNTPFWATDLDIADNHLYVADQSGGLPPSFSALTILDIADPSLPRLVSSYTFDGNLFHVAVSDSYAFLGTGLSGVFILDVSDPESPMPVSCYYTPGFALETVPFGDLLLVIHRPNNPPTTDDYSVDLCGNREEVSDSLTFCDTSCQYPDLILFDVTNIQIPHFLGAYCESGYAVDLALTDTYAYVADVSGGITVVDIADPSAMRRLACINTITKVEDIVACGDYLYAASAESGFTVVDISEPALPIVLSRYDSPGWAGGVAHQGQYAYVADGPSGLLVLDVSSPHLPKLAGRFDTPDWATDIIIRDSFAFVADRYSGLQVIDISTPSLPVRVATYPSPGTEVLFNRIVSSGDYLYLSGGGPSFQIICVANPHQPVLAGVYTGVDDISGLSASGNCVFLTTQRSGMQIICVSNPSSPFLADRSNMPGSGHAIDAIGQQIYVADYYSLIAMEILGGVCQGNPDRPCLGLPDSYELHQNYPNPFNSCTIIEYDIRYHSFVDLSVYNLLGQRIMTLVQGHHPASRYTVPWNGTNDQGQPVSSGVYIYEMSADNSSKSKKMILLK
ncbi:MAG: T9SS type A sorting domain-containing protein [bacterium]